MSFLFGLPTTSNLPYPTYLSSVTHPSLPQTATTYRNVLRNVLKKHKRLTAPSKSSNLSAVSAALNDYLPFLFALDAGLSGRPVNNEEVDMSLRNEIQVEWQTTLISTIPGREAPRIRGKGLDYEVFFIINTLAETSSLQARSQLHALYASMMPEAEQRTSIIAAATKLLLQANSIHNYLASRAVETDASSAVIETLSQTQGGLAALAVAEATLLAVLKDDPYPAVVAQDRNKNDKDWMIKPPEIPKVRAHLFARLCLAAAEHTSKAEAMLSASGRVDAALIRYVNDLKKTSKAKACRFFGIDAELGGETGQGIAWLVGGKKQLGFGGTSEDGSKMKGLAKLKKGWSERREDKKIEKGGEWGSDAGRLEESRVIEMLDQKWNKMNDTINTQVVPPSDPLMASMPSGRDIHSTRPFVPPCLDEDTLTRMRAPPEPNDVAGGEDSSNDEEEGGGDAPPGAFPEGSHTGSSENPYF